MLILPKHLKGDFFHEPLHAQQRSKVRVVINSAGNGQQLRKAPAGDQPIAACPVMSIKV